jgi:AraC-like DNA-binding protein
VWKFSHEHGGRRPRHFHAEPEFNFVVAGSATFGIGECVAEVSAGELLAFPPGQDHVLLGTSPDVYLFAIGMDPAFSAKVLGRDRKAVTQPLHIRLPVDECRALFSRVSSVVDRNGVEQQTAELWEHANWLRQKNDNRFGAAMHVLTRRTLDILDDAPELERDILARKLQAPPSAISRYFHRDMGLTLVQYRTRLKLLRFIHLVDGGSENLVIASKAAGFGSYSQCHRAFQAEFGCAPRGFFLSGLRQQMQLTYDR